MNFVQRMILRKEVDETMNAIKKYWPTGLHVIAAGALFLDPAMRQFFQGHPQYSSVGLVLWAELMHWLQSPRS